MLIAWAEPASKPAIAGVAAEAASVVRILNDLPRSHVEVDTVAHATPESLRERVLAFRPHVLHFAGHGALPSARDDAEDGVNAPSLVLELPHPGQRQHAYFSDADLKPLCADAGVQVVILNSCWGAKTTQQFVGLAQSLTASVGPRKPLPVVVAHQKPVRQSAAPAFAWAVYKKLVSGSPLEEGVAPPSAASASKMTPCARARRTGETLRCSWALETLTCSGPSTSICIRPISAR